ncbi:MAG: hypothetical protein FJZ01_01235 [Candidatus Sericytochromatia bacterium]|nr:hypothetical protein [Candidatus Tanganyikabacteria bacterium]
MTGTDHGNGRSARMAAFERASRHLLCTAAEADSSYGAAVAAGVEDIDEWAHGAEVDLGEHFEVVWAGSAEADLETLDRLAAHWPEPPEEEVLLEIALTWGALLGERIVDAVGGAWAYRGDPLHHSLVFPRKGVAFFPMHAIVARFLLGDSAGIEAAYHYLVEYLTES